MPQNLTVSLAELSDASLVNLVRDGNDRAYSVLWERHRQAAQTAARGIAKHDPEDMAQEAFARILQAIRNGAGPTEGFRPYLYATLRTISMAWSVKDPSMFSLDEQIDSLQDGTNLADVSADRSMTVRAFTALPKEWRTVLWYTEVEGMTPAEVAPILGMTAGSVAALSFRARNGLRESWLQTHNAIASPEAPDDCQWAHRHFASYLRDSISARRAERLQNHLVDCFPCSTSFAELSEVNGSLRGLLLPLFLGVPAAVLHKSGLILAPTLGTALVGPAVPLAPFPATLQWIEGNKPAAIGAAVGVVAVVAVGIAFAVTASSGSEPPADAGASQSVAAPQASPAGPSGQSGTAATSPSPQTEEPEAFQSQEAAETQTPQPNTIREPVAEPTTAPPPVPVPSASPSPPLLPGVSMPGFIEPTTPTPSPSVAPPLESTPEPTPEPTETVNPVEPPPDPTEPPEVVVPEVADLIAEPVVHTQELMPRVLGTGEPGAVVQALRDGAVIGQTLIMDSGQWNLDIPSVEVTSPQTTLQFEMRQVVTNNEGQETVSPSTPLLNSDGSTGFAVKAPSWSHISKSPNVALGAPNAVSSGGTISVRSGQSDGIYFYFAGDPGTRIRVHINGTPTNTLHPGGSLLERRWSQDWDASHAGPQRIELSYSDGERRGAHVAFEFALEVQ